MIKYIFSCLILLNSLNLLGQLGSTIQKVKVFQNGAQVYRTASISLKKGEQSILLTGLSPFINKNTIQANLNEVKIIDVSYSVNHLETNKDNSKISSLKTSIKNLEFDIQKEENLKSSLNLELDLILSNQDLKGQEALDLEDLKEFIDYYKSKIPELKGKISDSENQLYKFKLVLSKLEKQLQELEKTQKLASGEIELTVISAKSQQLKASLNYHTAKCGWSPLYSLRASDLNSPISFEYSANVFQNTGVEWNNLPVTLVTGNPIRSGIHPTLSPWTISDSKRYDRGRKSKSSNYEKKDGLAYGYAAPMKKMSVHTSNLTFSEFQLNQKYSVKSGEKPVRMLIDINSLPASFEYYCAPKRSNSVYLLANISGWEKLSLIPGKANIFFDNTYVGNSYIDPKTNNDTLAVSLGQDQSIIVDREKITDKCKTNTIGFSKKHNRAYRINIKNNRQEAINIRLVDQIPVSSNEKIKVTLNKSGDGKLDPETGILEWEFNIPKGDLKSTSFEYEVKHPRKYNVAI